MEVCEPNMQQAQFADHKERCEAMLQLGQMMNAPEPSGRGAQVDMQPSACMHHQTCDVTDACFTCATLSSSPLPSFASASPPCSSSLPLPAPLPPPCSAPLPPAASSASEGRSAAVASMGSSRAALPASSRPSASSPGAGLRSEGAADDRRRSLPLPCGQISLRGHAAYAVDQHTHMCPCPCSARDPYLQPNAALHASVQLTLHKV